VKLYICAADHWTKKLLGWVKLGEAQEYS